MKVGTKVITSNGLFGEIVSIGGRMVDFHGAGRRIAHVKLDITGQTLSYWMDTIRKRKSKPIKLKKFSAWK